MKVKIEIGELFEALNISHDGSVEKEHIVKDKVKIKNHENKFVPILSYVTKTIDSYETTYLNGERTITANEHLILTKEGCKKIKDITNEDITIIDDFGEVTYTKKIQTNLHKENDTLYDFCLDNPHLYKTTNGFVHHNSLIQYSIIRYLLAAKKKILLIVPSVSLVEQMYSDFKEYGWSDVSDFVDKLYAGQELSDKPILISTYQSLAKKSPGFFSKFTALIIDEAHSATSVSIQSIAKHCVNAEYRLGFTGTVPKNEANRATLFGYLGPISYELKAKELIDQGVISQIKINNLIMKYPQEYVKIGLDYQSEVKHIIKYEDRNKALDYILNNTDKTHNTLILVQRIEHLKMVKEYLEKKHPTYSIYDYYGESTPEYRERVRKDIEKKGSTIIVSNFACFSTGISVKRLHNIVFFSSYKSEIKIIQSIGRGLRKHESKDHMILWDCVDDLRYKDGGKMVKNYSYKHWQNRKSYYEEQGFEYSDITINI